MDNLKKYRLELERNNKLAKSGDTKNFKKSQEKLRKLVKEIDL